LNYRFNSTFAEIFRDFIRRSETEFFEKTRIEEPLAKLAFASDFFQKSDFLNIASVSNLEIRFFSKI